MTGDILDKDALGELVREVHAVVHVAGLIKARSRQMFFEINEEGARRVAQASDGRRLIHVSSLAAREPGLSDYAASKFAGEKAVQDVAGATATIVRPPVIYGPGDRETLALFRMARAPAALIPAVANARVAIAAVDDVVGTIIDLIKRSPAQPIVAIGGDRPSGYSWLEILSAAAHAVGGTPRIVPVPGWLVLIAGATLEGIGKWQRNPPIFTMGKAREALHADWSVAAVERDKGARLEFTPLDEGFARTVAWYRTHQWLR